MVGAASFSVPPAVSELKRDRQLFGISSGGHGEIESIVSPEMQLILDPRDGPSLYNWQADSQERVNLFFAPSLRSRPH